MGGNKIDTIGSDLSQILDSALKKNAKTIHIEPRDKIIIIRFRIDSRLVVAYKLSKKKSNIINEVISWANLRKDHYSYEANMKYLDNDLKINILPTLYGHKITIHVEDNYRTKNLKDLGLWGENLSKVHEFVSGLVGIMVISGPDVRFTDTLVRSVEQFGVTAGLKSVRISSHRGNIDSALKEGAEIYSLKLQSPNHIKDIVDHAKHKMFICELSSNGRMDLLTKLNNLGFDEPHLYTKLKLILSFKVVKRACPNCSNFSTDGVKSVGLVEKAIGIKSTLNHDQIINLKKRIAKDLSLDDENYHESKGCEKCSFSGYSGNIGVFETTKIEIREGKLSLIRLGETFEVDGLIKALVGLIDLKDASI